MTSLRDSRSLNIIVKGDDSKQDVLNEVGWRDIS